MNECKRRYRVSKMTEDEMLCKVYFSGSYISKAAKGVCFEFACYGCEDSIMHMLITFRHITQGSVKLRLEIQLEV